MLTACDDPEFVRDTGQLPAEAGKTPSGALYAVGSFEPQLQDFYISEDTQVGVVYRLDYPAPSDVTVMLALGSQYDVDAINDARGLKDKQPGPMVTAPYKRYRLLPETNYTRPASLTLTVPKGKTESAPLSLTVVYDDNLLPPDASSGSSTRMQWPWMLPLCVEKIEGDVVALAGQVLGIGVRPADMLDGKDENNNRPIELLQKEEDFTFITYCDCREYNPASAIYYYYYKVNYIEKNGRYIADRNSKRYSPTIDVEILHPAFLTVDAKSGMPVIKPNSDLLYVLTHQERYVDPQRKLWMKICVSLETERKSPMGLCNLSDEARASLVWQIKNFVETYKLDGVAFNDKPADYMAAGAPVVDKASYTKFLKDLRTALGADKLIMVSYDADENSALYEAHDGLRAGDYIDWAWWGTANEICTPYAAAPSVQPIAGLDVKKFSPIAADCVETDIFKRMFTEFMNDEGTFYQAEAMPILYDLADAGQCDVVVYMGLRGDVQGFYESAFFQIPERFSSIPLRDGSSTSPGWSSNGTYSRNAMKNLPTFGGYGAGLKDW